MLDMSRSRSFRSIERPVVSGQSIAEEGLALMYQPSGGAAGFVQTADATAGRVLAGISYGTRVSPTTFISVETYTIPSSSPYTVTVTQAITSGTVLAKLASGTVLTVTGSPPATGEVQVTGGSAVLTFNSAQAGLTFTVTYRYSLTVQQAQMLVGDPQPSSNTPATATGQIGMMLIGDIYTSEFDSSVDWNAANVVDIRLAANGRMTIGGSGTVVYPAVKVIAGPTADYPFLGLSIAIQ